MGNLDISDAFNDGWTIGVFAAIQNHKGHVLISERRDGLGWNLPGGRAESHELIHGLAREVYEETGLHITGHPRLVNQYPSKEMRDLALLYMAKATGKPKASPEALRHIFVGRVALQREIRLVRQDFPGHNSGRMWLMVTEALGAYSRFH